MEGLPPKAGGLVVLSIADLPFVLGARGTVKSAVVLPNSGSVVALFQDSLVWVEEFAAGVGIDNSE